MDFSEETYRFWNVNCSSRNMIVLLFFLWHFWFPAISFQRIWQPYSFSLICNDAVYISFCFKISKNSGTDSGSDVVTLSNKQFNGFEISYKGTYTFISNWNNNLKYQNKLSKFVIHKILYNLLAMGTKWGMINPCDD